MPSFNFPHVDLLPSPFIAPPALPLPILHTIIHDYSCNSSVECECFNLIHHICSDHYRVYGGYCGLEKDHAMLPVMVWYSQTQTGDGEEGYVMGIEQLLVAMS